MRLKAVERNGKRLLMAIMGPLLGTRPVSQGWVHRRRLRRILVVRQDERLGNVLLITPLLEGLRRVLPKARISVLVSRRFAPVLQGNGDIDQLLTFDKRQLLKHPLRLAAFLKGLRRGSFDLAIDCGPVDDVSLNNSLLTYLSGARWRVGHQRGNSHIFLNLSVPRRNGERHETERHLDLLRHLFGDIPAGPPKILLRPEERARAVQRWRTWGLGDAERAVAVHLGGRGDKQWGIERYRMLADRLVSQDGVKVILFWGPDEKEMVQRLDAGSRPGVIVSPLLAVRDLAAQIEMCSVFVGNDTGPLHLASAVRTPTVAVFLQPNFNRYGPRGGENIVIHHPHGHITTEQVHAAVRELLDR
jgi:ADP-heptose:LPS heptosyltransferase